MAIDINQIKLSYGRCLMGQGDKRKFFDFFYDRFLGSSPEISEKFSRTDFERQKEALQHGISMAILYAEKKDTVAEQILSGIKSTHSSAHMNIKPEHYQLWVDNLIIAVREFDNKFDDSVEKNWRELAQLTVDFMLS